MASGSSLAWSASFDLSGSSGHSDQDDFDGSVVLGYQKATSYSPDPRLHVVFGGTMGMWVSI